MNYIESSYDNYFESEQNQEVRSTLPDTRVHALIYFLPPYGSK